MPLLGYLIYVTAACLLIFIVPGPLFFLSIKEGAVSLRRGFLVLVGTLAGEAVLLALLFAGFTVALREVITPLKALGAIVLAWMGLSAVARGLRGISHKEL